MRAVILVLVAVAVVGCRQRTEPLDSGAPALPASAVEPLPAAPPVATPEPRLPSAPTAAGEAGAAAAADSAAALPDGAASDSPDGATLERARQAALEGRSRDVRKLLEAKVRKGLGTAEEVRLVKGACQAMNDAACLADVKKKPRG